MRLDKFLKVSRIFKRRSVATEICDAGRVKVNQRVAKPATKVEPGDVLEIEYNQNLLTLKIKAVQEFATKEGAGELYEVLTSEKLDASESEIEEI